MEREAKLGSLPTNINPINVRNSCTIVRMHPSPDVSREDDSSRQFSEIERYKPAAEQNDSTKGEEYITEDMIGPLTR